MDRTIPEEGSIGAIHNWHDDKKWEHYQIVNGKAVRISTVEFHEQRKKRTTVNQPLYVED